ncbi:unnamed protein product [Cuscuta epithymum]|uniref:Uncharacterized protein n=1 Tax=Cuscuta epithymum TaxID=186058 RepID=A0AAV0CR17_9ASTE|nr:unnamed protein product [Cuscuta epithymum]
MQFTIVWFLFKATDLEFAKIPVCMHRHLFEHAKLYARLIYGAATWTVKVEDFSFTDGFPEFLIENNVECGTYMLLRHIGNFTFQVLMFDDLGFSLNLAGPPSGSSITSDKPDDFMVYVESCVPDCTYRQLYLPASFLYVRGQTSKVHVLFHYLVAL